MRVLFRLGTLGGQHLDAKGGSWIALIPRIALILASLRRQLACGVRCRPRSRQRSTVRKKPRALGACTTGIKLKAGMNHADANKIGGTGRIAVFKEIHRAA